jgi:hypothetical protein
VSFTTGHHFAPAGQADPAALAAEAAAPLSVILQLTKRCDFDCVFCSETLQMADPSLEQLGIIRANLAGVPGDPYRTGQQLYRRPAPRLAAFTAVAPASGSRYAPAAVATVYLPLHRTRTVTVTEQTLAFGFRAATASGQTEAPALAGVADLDLMQARRHATILAGHMLDGDLAAL